MYRAKSKCGDTRHDSVQLLSYGIQSYRTNLKNKKTMRPYTPQCCTTVILRYTVVPDRLKNDAAIHATYIKVTITLRYTIVPYKIRK